ncbi:putative GTPase-activating protein BEM2/IPL2 (putative) [Pseudozyma hubeiensis]|nr:putative GTPase-activating protein BEM2/IPL2 (putative) [Pseudozyma hubeiensis]
MDSLSVGASHIRRSTEQHSRAASSNGYYSDGTASSAADISSSLLDTFSTILSEADSYITLFEGRIRLEEDYIRSLRISLERQKELDAKVSSKIVGDVSLMADAQRFPGLRRAWLEMRQNDQRELEARSYMVETCRQGVLAPLLAFRDAQERIRKRVKEDVRTSLSQYDEMRNTNLPRIRRTYEKRAEEVENLQLQAQAVEDQRTLLSTRTAEREPASSSHSRQPSHPDFDPTARSPPSTFPGSTGSSLMRRKSSRSRHHSRHHSDASSKSLGASAKGNRSSDERSVGSPPVTETHLPATASALSTSPPSPSHEKTKPNFFEAFKTREGWDAARKEAPKKIGALINRMREGGQGGAAGFGVDSGPPTPSMSETLLGTFGGSNNNNPYKATQTIAAKQARAKREVDEADKAYRKAIFDLETLRLRRLRTLKAAAASVIECRTELANTAQAVWLQSERSQIVLYDKSSGLHQHSEDMVKAALNDFDQELRSMEENLPGARTLEDTRVSYVNYWHGELKNLIFGTPLTDYPLTVPYRLSDTVAPPLIVTKCIDFIDMHAINLPGIYRISAKQSSVKQLALAIEKDELGFQFDPAKDEPAAVAGVFKDYLRQLPEPVLAIPWAERIKYTHEREEHIRTGFATLKGKIRRLPPIHQITLKVIVQHLSRLAQHADQNKMTAANLSVVFSPCLLSEADHETTSVAAAMEEDKTMEDLILYCNDIFDLKTAGAPLLPPISATRAGELSRAGQSAADAAFAASSPITDSSIDVPSPSDLPIVSGASLRRSNAITPAIAAGSDGSTDAAGTSHSRHASGDSIKESAGATQGSDLGSLADRLHDQHVSANETTARSLPRLQTVDLAANASRGSSSAIVAGSGRMHPAQPAHRAETDPSPQGHTHNLQTAPRSSTGLSGEEGSMYLAATSTTAPSPLAVTSNGPLTPGLLTPASLRSPLDNVIDSAQASQGHPTPTAERADQHHASSITTTSPPESEGTIHH